MTSGCFHSLEIQPSSRSPSADSSQSQPYSRELTQLASTSLCLSIWRGEKRVGCLHVNCSILLCSNKRRPRTHLWVNSHRYHNKSEIWKRKTHTSTQLSARQKFRATGENNNNNNKNTRKLLLTDRNDNDVNKELDKKISKTKASYNKIKIIFSFFCFLIFFSY